MYFERTEENEETTKHTTTNRSFAIYQRCLQQKRGDQLPLHWHDELQIVWVEEGSFVYTIDDEQILLNKNEAIIINSRVLHGAVLASENVRYCCFDFSSGFIADPVFKEAIEQLVHDCTRSYRRLTLTAQHQAFVQTVRLPLLIEQRFTLYELFLAALSQLMAARPASPKKETIYLMLAFVHEHYQEPLTVPAIAKAAAINTRTCTALFRQYTTLTPINYLIDYRLSQAKNLLIETDEPISTICYHVGFNHLSYFSKRFQRKFGLTPLQYRKTYREDDRN
ncbi:AraC family transcriptional regulator [Enterococcus casseliflavus]|uniref:AraC family transcriptional regulator n=1 Tax=Enterococcus casseliflavus TaxID=37734 RepID=UPI000F4ED068|nr:AraC family transcriptional regulator [Enterococcus casseliflavus]ROY40843.1 AraC family transcriptional regulator [Enterococcus casseliflavus]